MVFYDVDPKNKNKVIEQEEELQVDEAWVRDEFSEEDVQHIINMRLEDNWIQAPRARHQGVDWKTQNCLSVLHWT
jgi:hypothetical protein